MGTGGHVGTGGVTWVLGSQGVLGVTWVLG